MDGCCLCCALRVMERRDVAGGEKKQIPRRRFAVLIGMAVSDGDEGGRRDWRNRALPRAGFAKGAKPCGTRQLRFLP
jgi:hypothetical protein